MSSRRRAASQSLDGLSFLSRRLRLEPLEARLVLTPAVLLTTFPDQTPVKDDFFGQFVAPAGNDVLIGAEYDDEAGANSGAAYLFDSSGTLLRTFLNPTPGDADRFGFSGAATASHIVVGALWDDAGATNSGAVHVFNRTTGAFVRTIANPTPAAGDEFGISIVPFFSDILVGARYDDTAGTDAGAFYRINPSTGALVRTYLNPDPDPLDEFGSSLAYSSGMVIAGARADDLGAIDAGVVHVLEAFSGGLLLTIPNPAPAQGDVFGWSVAGFDEYIVVGAPTDGAGSGTGEAYLFDSSTGDLIRAFTSPSPSAAGQFGYSLAVVRSNVLVGERLADTTVNNGGAAWLFDPQSGELIAEFVDPAAATANQFGESVAALGDNVLIGAFQTDGIVQDMGAAYLFDVPPYADITVAPDPRQTAVDEIEIAFSESVTGLDLGDLRLTRNGGGNLLTGSQTLVFIDNWTLGNLAALTEPEGDYELTLAGTGTGIEDSGGNPLAFEVIESWTVATGVAFGMGGTGDDRGHAVAVDAQGNMFVGGIFAETVDFDPGPGVVPRTRTGGQEGFIARYATSGDLLWVAGLAGTGFARVNEIALDGAGNILVAGEFSGQVDFDPDSGSTVSMTNSDLFDVFLLKLTADGDFVWVKRLVGNGSIAYDMGIDPSGNVYATGTFSGTVDFDPGSGSDSHASVGGNDIYVVKLDASGNQVWSRQIGSSNFEIAEGLAINRDGEVYIVGSFNESLDFGTGSKSTIGGSDDLFVWKLNASGSTQRVQTFGGTGFDLASGVAVDSNDDVIVTGRFSGSADFDPGPAGLVTSSGALDSFVLKLNNDTDGFMWVVKQGGSADDAGLSVALDQLDDIYVSGFFHTTSDFDHTAVSAGDTRTSDGFEDSFLLKLDTDGGFVSVRAVQGPGDDEAASDVAVLSSEYVVGVGYHSAAADLDFGSATVPLANAGNKDIYVWKLHAPTDSVWPTVDIVDVTPDPRNSAIGAATIVFSEAVTGFGIDDLAMTFAGGADLQTGAVTLVTSDNITWSLNGLTSMTFAEGDYSLALTAAGSGITDLSGNPLNSNASESWVVDSNLAFALGAGGDEIDSGMAIVADGAGGVYVAGAFRETADFDPGPATANLVSAGENDIFVAHYLPGGALGWAHRMGGTADDDGLAIATDGAGGIYVTGGYEGAVDFNPGSGTSVLTSTNGRDTFILKLDSAGNFLWARGLDGGGSQDIGNALAADSAGNVFVTGEFRSTVDFNPGAGSFPLTSAGQTDSFVLKLNSAGDFVWARKFGGTNSESGFGIAVGPSGKVYFNGQYGGTHDFDDGPGTVTLFGQGFTDIFVAALDSSGGVLWAKGVGSAGFLNFDEALALAIDAQENVYSTGRFRGTVDFNPGPGVASWTSAGDYDQFLLKLDSTGSYVWSNRIGSSGVDQGQGLAVRGSDLYLAGIFQGTVDLDPGPGVHSATSEGGFDAMLARFDTSGAFIDANTWGSGGADRALAVAVDAASNPYVTGRIGGTTDFAFGPGTYELNSQGGSDFFVAAFRAIPRVAIAAVLPDPRSTALDTATIRFSEPVTGFSLADLRLDRDDGVNLLTSLQTLTTTDNTVWTLGNLGQLTGPNGDYTLRVVATGSGIIDADGLRLAGSATESWQMAFISTLTQVQSHSPVGNANGFVAPSINHFTLKFSNAIDESSANLAFVRVTGPTGEIEVDSIGEDNGAYYFNFSQPQSQNGTYHVTILPGFLDSLGQPLDQDADGVPGEPLDAYTFSFKIDTVPPRIALHTPAGDVSGSISSVDVIFNEAIDAATFTTADVSVKKQGGPELGATGVTPAGYNRYRIAFPTQSALGLYHVKVGPNVLDLAGNALDADGDGVGGEATEDVYDADFTLVQVDVVLQNLAVGVPMVTGQSVQITWSGKNLPGAALVGAWTDAVFLSTNTTLGPGDKLLGTYAQLVPLAAGQSYSAAVVAQVPGVPSGEYYILARADILDDEKEGAGESNNMISIGPVAVGFAPLAVGGAAVVGTLSPTDTVDYYRIDVTNTQTVQLNLDGSGAAGTIEVFVRRRDDQAADGGVPTQSMWDFAARAQSGETNGLDRRLAFKPTAAGTYYVMVRGSKGPGNMTYSLEADGGEVFVTAISPDRGVKAAAFSFGRPRGRVIPNWVTITGAGFSEQTTVEFVDAGGTHRLPQETVFVSPTQLAVKLNLAGWAVGAYDVHVADGPNIAQVWNDYYTVASTGLPKLETKLVLPSAVGYNLPIRQTIWIEYANTGNAAMHAPLLTLLGGRNEAFKPLFTLDPALAVPSGGTAPPDGVGQVIQVFAAGSGATPGVLQAGDKGRIPVYYVGLTEPAYYQDVPFELLDLTADHVSWSFSLPGLGGFGENWDFPWDVNAVRDELRPQEISVADWPDIWNILEVQIGGSGWGHYVEALADDMIELNAAGEPTSDPALLWSYEVQQAAAGYYNLNYQELAEEIKIAKRDTPGKPYKTPAISSFDPNDKIGTDGTPIGNFVATAAPLSYTIRFENTGTAAAQRIELVDTLDSDLDVNSFALSGLQLGPLPLTPFAPGSQQADLQLAVASPSGLQAPGSGSVPPGVVMGVDVNVEFDRATRILRVVLQAFDPNPADPYNLAEHFFGLLYPGQQGLLSFIVAPMPDRPTGTIIENEATIVFDGHAGIATPRVTRILDSAPPASGVGAFSAAQTNQLTNQVAWNGEDLEEGINEEGSGVAQYDVWMAHRPLGSSQSPAYVLLRDSTKDTSLSFTGALDHAYSFYTVASDNVGNAEPHAAIPDATISLIGPPVVLAAPIQTRHRGIVAAPADAGRVTLNDLPRYQFYGTPDKLTSGTINWGDGSPTEAAIFLPGGNGGTLGNSHAYTTSGTKTISLTVTDAWGRQASGTLGTVTIDSGLAVGGTSGADTFDLTAQAAAGSVQISRNGSSLGTFTVSQILVDGGDGTDLVRVIGTSAANAFTIAAATVAVNGATIDEEAVESWSVDGKAGNDSFTITGGSRPVAVAGGDGNDAFLFDADSPLGSFSLSDSKGTETLNFSATTLQVVAVNLGVTTAQAVNGNLTLTLASATAFEHITGGSQGDTLTGNTLANTIIGGAGNDALSGGGGNDKFPFDADTQLGSDTLSDSGGTDLIDFVTTTTKTVTLDLSSTAAQIVNSNLTLTLAAGNAIENLTGGTKDDVLTGNALANVLTGGSGNDTLNGGGGNDTLSGVAGNDTLNGGDQNDTLTPGAGNDTANGGPGDDRYVLDVDAALGSDTLDESGGGIDTLDFSGTGNKPLTVNLATAGAQTVHSPNLTLTLGSGSTFENVIGGKGVDSLTGNALDNQLTGGGGNDTLTGAAGDDTYLFDADAQLNTDTLNESGGGFDTLDFTATGAQNVTVNLATAGSQPVNSFLTLNLGSATMFEKVIGGNKNDALTGNSLANILLGGKGTDTLSGGGERDLLIGGLLADILNGDAGDDILIAGTTSHDGNADHLEAILNLWLGAGNYTSRTTALRDGTGVPQLKANVTALNDVGTDNLTGGNDQDWYFRALADILNTPEAGELVEVLT